jgi:hypothetical protein
MTRMLAISREVAGEFPPHQRGGLACHRRFERRDGTPGVELPVGQSRDSGALKPRFANFALVSNSNYDLIYRSNVGIDSVIPWTDNS